MYNFKLHQQINQTLEEYGFDIGNLDNQFYARFISNAEAIHALYLSLYSHHPLCTEGFSSLLKTIASAYSRRSASLKQRDGEKKEHWFLSNTISGMSLYVDRFCGDLATLATKLDYFKGLGVNLLHLMPLFQSPAEASDGGYAVSDFRKVDERFGTMEDLMHLQKVMVGADMYLMTDIVLNHTSNQHEWALQAKSGNSRYQQYFYMYDDRMVPDAFEQKMPEIFPESSPGSFTYEPACNKWVMTVFHQYQWDLNYTNPAVFIEMLDTIFFYANLGIDILRIDAPAFIWKQIGTSCQNLPEAHNILRLIKQCVQVATPGMALLGEAIVAPADIMKYFGTDEYTAKECDFAYNATHMALQWDALATGNTRIMLAAQHEISKKPFGTTWITYTRCHDDIGLGYDDYMIEQAGFNAYEHRKFLKEYYSGVYLHSPATGALFSVNPKTQDARISGSLASLCGLEKALKENNPIDTETSLQKIILMQAHSFFLGGVPMIFYGDEVAYTNDYSYLDDPSKSYDNRWMHRPRIDWAKNNKSTEEGTVEYRIFTAIKELIRIRKELPVVADHKNLEWLTPHNIHIVGYLRFSPDQKLFCVFNFSNQTAYLTWYAFKEKGHPPTRLYDHWRKRVYTVERDNQHLEVEAYGFYLFEAL